MPHDGHDHHDHATTLQPDIREPTEEWEFLEIALRELLIEKGVLTAREIADTVEAWEQKTPQNGARIVAKAWTDAAFKTRLLADGTSAVAELGFVFEGTKLVAVENTAELHHMVVCTLCSCYPRSILGQPPSWYISKAYRARSVREPRRVLAEFGLDLSDDIQLVVHDSNADMRYLVLPQPPAGAEHQAPSDLEALISRDHLIGVARDIL